MEETSFEQQRPKRVPSLECFLNEIKGSEKRVSVIVSIVSVNRAEKNAIASDGSMEAVLRFENTELLKKAKEGIFMRVIGRPVSINPLEIEVEIAQELKDFDSKLFKTVKEQWSKLRG